MSYLLEVPAGKIPGPGARSLLRLQGCSIALFNVAGSLYAIDDSCPHQGSSLFGGKLDGMQVQCPAHGLKFNLATGCMGNSGLKVRTYAVQRSNEGTWLTLPAEPVDSSSS